MRKTQRRHQQGEESHNRILDAAAEIAAERGYEGTTVSLVSRRSGLPVSSIYWHFESKDQLIAAVIRRSYDAWVAELPDVSDLARLEGASRAEQLAAVIGREAASLARHPDFLRFGLLLTLEQREEEPAARRLFLQVRDESLQRIRDGYRMLVAIHGVVRDDDFIDDLARFTMAAVDGIFVAAQADPTRDVGRLVEVLARSVDGLIDGTYRIDPHNQLS